MKKMFLRLMVLILCLSAGLYIGYQLNKVEIVTTVFHHETIHKVIKEVITEIQSANVYRQLKDSVVTVVSSGLRCGGGTIISEDGYILTCNHVLIRQKKVYVSFKDSHLRSFEEDFIEAEVIAVNKEYDMAIIRVDMNNLKPVELADVSKLRPGDPVIAIGTPHSQAKAISHGIISKIDAFVTYPRINGIKRHRIDDIILADIGINPGNSGGGLFTLDGKLIGITNLTGGDNHAIVIPITYALDMIKSIKED